MLQLGSPARGFGLACFGIIVTTLMGCPPPPPPGPPPSNQPKPLLFVGSSARSLEVFALEAGGPRNLPQMVRQELAPRPSMAVAAMQVVGTSLYVTGGGTGGVVEQYEIDPVAAKLTLRSSTPAGDQPLSIAASATTLYVANRLSENISVYTIGSGGSLSPLQTANVPGVVSLGMDGSGKFLVSADRAGGSNGPQLCSHAIQANGSLGGSASCVAVAATPHALRASGNVLFTLLYGNATAPTAPTTWVAAWTVDPTTGALTHRGAELDIGPANSADMALSTDGKTLFIPRQGGFSAVSTSDPLGHGPVSFPSNPSDRACQLPPALPGRIVVDPRGTVLYILDPVGVLSGNIQGPRVSAIEITSGAGAAPIVCDTAASLPTALALFSP